VAYPVNRPPPPANRYRERVPRYFFHVYDDLILRDEEGIELADAQGAHAAALAGARAMMCDQLTKGRLSLHHRIEVEDEWGAAILILPFGDAIRIETTES
jgi:hypothetical protein